MSNISPFLVARHNSMVGGLGNWMTDCEQHKSSGGFRVTTRLRLFTGRNGCYLGRER